MILKFIVIILAFFLLVAFVSSPIVRGRGETEEGSKGSKGCSLRCARAEPGAESSKGSIGLRGSEGGVDDSAASEEGRNVPHSVADEISKLADLKERGYLTAEEFEQQKRKLLDGK